MLKPMSFAGRLARSVVAASTIVLLAACTGNTAGCVAIPVPNVPAITVPTLISPAPGATGVSTGPLDVTIGNAAGAGPLFLTDDNGKLTFGSNLRQTDPPSDARISTFAQLASQTTYHVYAGTNAFGGGSGCSPAPVVTRQNVLLGSFTTR